MAENLNNFFIEIVENLEIDYFLERDKYEGNPNNTIEDIVKIYVRHPSVLKIKEYITPENAFSFSPTTTQQFEIEIQQLDPIKQMPKMICLRKF